VALSALSEIVKAHAGEAIAFFRLVGATAYLAEAETLVATSRSA
jgi:hypothetical protein